MDLASVPAEHLTSLTSCVKTSSGIVINNVNNCDLVCILDSARCEFLYIIRQTLSSEETRALVRAMETGVEKLTLGNGLGDVRLDITALTQYSGQGKCRGMICYMNDGQPWHNAVDQYIEELRSWAKMRINWFDDNLMVFLRKRQ